MAQVVRNGDKTDAQRKAETDQQNRRYAVEYEEAKAAAEAMETRRKSLREVILGRVRQFGDRDEDGNVWLPAIDRLMKAERREKKQFDSAKAERWLRDNGWWDEAKETVPEQVIPEHDVVTEEGLAAFIYRKRKDSTVPNDLPDGVYNVSENFALKVTKETHYGY